MITIGGRNDLAPEAVSEMHQFRYEIFVRRLGWALPLAGGIERDEYDTDEAIYVLARDMTGRITACARLLPTTTRCMLSDLFGVLLGGKTVPSDPAMWELSRFATSVRKTGEGRVLSLSQPTMDLLDAILQYARKHGTERLILVTSVAIERLMLRAGYDTHRLAAPARVDGNLCVALIIEVPAECSGAEPELYQEIESRTH